MRAPDELVDPVSYSSLWLWLAVVGLVVVVAYYLLVAWAGRRRPEVPRQGGDVATVRQRHLGELERIEREVASGSLPAREGHQQLSTTLRSYVAEVTPVNAPVLALDDLRRRAGELGPQLVDALEVMYPPEFAPDDVGGAERAFDDAARRARTLVETWS